jgi:hypothetical protein
MVSPRELVISAQPAIQVGPEGSSPGRRLRRTTRSAVTSVLAFCLKASEDLGQTAPADVANQHALLGGRWGAGLGFEAFEEFEGGEISAELLFQ